MEAQEAMRADPGGSTKKLKKRAIAIVLENDNESSAVGLHRLERQGHMMQAESIQGKSGSRLSFRSAPFHSECHSGYITT